MTKVKVVCAESTGAMRYEKAKDKPEDKRWVHPLYPLETTTIDKSILDKAIEDAIEKRLRLKK